MEQKGLIKRNLRDYKKMFKSISNWKQNKLFRKEKN